MRGMPVCPLDRGGLRIQSFVDVAPGMARSDGRDPAGRDKRVARKSGLASLRLGAVVTRMWPLERRRGVRHAEAGRLLRCRREHPITRFVRHGIPFFGVTPPLWRTIGPGCL